MIEKHPARKQTRLSDFAPGHDAVFAQFGHAPRRERFAIGMALFDDFECVTPVLLPGVVADVAHAGAIDGRQSRNGPQYQPIDRDERPKEHMQNGEIDRERLAETAEPITRAKHAAVLSRRPLPFRS